MVIKLFSVKSTDSNEVTIHELVVAREYYRFIEVDLKFVSEMNTVVAIGKGYTRIIDDELMLQKIRRVDRKKVMEI